MHHIVAGDDHLSIRRDPRRGGRTRPHCDEDVGRRHGERSLVGQDYHRVRIEETGLARDDLNLVTPELVFHDRDFGPDYFLNSA